MSAKPNRLIRWFRARRLARLQRVLSLDLQQTEQLNQVLLGHTHSRGHRFDLLRRLTDGQSPLADSEIDQQIAIYLGAAKTRFEAGAEALAIFVSGLDQQQRLSLNKLLTRRARCAHSG